MSQDIRNYFCKQNFQKKNATEEKPKKKAKKLITSDDDEVEEISPSKSKAKVVNKKNSKSSSKKRAIVSSDEDETEIISQTKTKKAKITKDKSPKKDIEELEEVSDVGAILGKKPVKRINAPKSIKKASEEATSKNKVDFLNENDDFDATLNQLDTTQIEDEYLATVKDESTSSFFQDGSKDGKFDSKKGEKDAKHKNGVKESEKTKSSSKDEEKPKNEKSPSSKENKNRNTDHSEKKHENKSKKKNTPHEKLEVEKVSKPNKDKEKDKEMDYNDIIQEKVEKKKGNAMLYQNYLNRGGARNPGSKEIPEGAENCLANLSFLITGVLDSLEREEAESIIKQYGGKILHAVSKKLNYIIVGDEPGPSKMAKAESLGVKKISEDELLDMLRSRPAGAGEHKNTPRTSETNKRKRDKSSSNDEHDVSEIIKKNKNAPKNVFKSPEKIKKSKEDSPTKTKNISPKKVEPIIPSPPKSESVKHATSTQESKTEVKKFDSPVNDKTKESTSSTIISNVGMDALVEKYRPKDLKQIIGQGGDKSNAKKLQFWLSNWHKYHGKGSKATKPKFNVRDDTGIIYKAALLSGSPGIGKTTTAYVVCAQLGFEIIEFNASDTRSKRLLQEEIAGILSNKSVKSFLTKDKEKTQPKHVLLMDEVDGMAGNEDRGGMQELIAFIKSTEVPIICICNDRQSQKIKTLANYTFDLRFQKPRLEQIRAAMMSICFKEDIKIKPDELTKIIQSTNQDIRQVINHISILSAKSQTEDENKEKTKYKNLKLGPWDVVRKVFSAEEHKHMNIHDKSDLFFHDYNIASLFVEENYLIVTPSGPKNELFEKLAKCSESLAIGDTIENNIRRNQAWSLLPVQACFSSVIPGTVMSGFINSQINFPSWLGKNSRTNKCDRLLQELTTHTRITTGASKEAINLDYLKMLVDSIIRPLAIEGVDGVEKAIAVMNNYHLTREDLDSLIELTKWPHTRDPMQSVDTKTKTAFTKAYNKTALFSSAGSTMKKKSSRDAQDDDFIVDDEDELVNEEDEEDDKLENDKLIKAKASSKAKSEPSGSKGKVKTTAKGAGRGRKK